MSNTPADLLRQYHAAKDNGDVELAQRLWLEYLQAVQAEMQSKEAA